jgi:hypothetical protein
MLVEKEKVMNELDKLKNTVRELLKAIEYVPMRAVDCDQDKVKKLIKKLEKATEK